MALPLVIDLRSGDKTPLHRQIYEQIRRAILTGKVRSHVKLPASRQLAKTLGVSRTTVTQSYDQLISEGYLHTRQGAGTFVCAQIPETLLNAERTLIQADGAALPLSTWDDDVREIKPAYDLSAYGLRLQQAPQRIFESECALSFRYGMPDLQLFPRQQWRRLLSRHQLADTHWMGYSPDPMGYRPLREQIAQYIAQVRAVRCHPEQILITHGAQQALGLITRLLMNPGDAIALENPGYISARQVFRAHGVRLVPISVDREGLQIEGPQSLSAVAPVPKLVYVTPSHQFPTGVLMSLSRRLALLQWAQQTNAFIIEDDYDSEFRYSGRPIPALQGLNHPGCDPNRVIYVGTFSKILFPGLQIGYVVVPPPLVALFQQAKWLSDRQCSEINQAALADFICDGELAKYLRRMRPIYGQRRQTLIAALQQAVETRADKAIEVLGDRAGLHIMVRLPSHSGQKRQTCDYAVVKAARDRQVGLFSAQPFYMPPQPPIEQRIQQQSGEFIFGFGGLDETGIKTAIARIQDIL